MEETMLLNSPLRPPSDLCLSASTMNNPQSNCARAARRVPTLGLAGDARILHIRLELSKWRVADFRRLM